MINLIKTLLLLIINDIDSGNSNISFLDLKKIIELILDINRKEFSKLEAADYIKVSRATFDNYVRKGLLPEGIKRQGFKEKFWIKSDLDRYLSNK